MDFWQRARSFAEEAAKRSEELRQGIVSTNLSDVVSEASKRSKELAAEASKRSKEFAAEALKRADQIAAQIPTALVDSSNSGPKDAGNDVAVEPEVLEKFGVTDDLKEFVKGITVDTFQDFPIEDDSEVSGTPMVSNVRQDLTEWQERHAKLVLLTVKEISKLRYQLCPRVMKERKFWKIYFILVKSHVTPYERSYMEDLKIKAAEKVKETEAKEISSGPSSEKANETSQSKNNNNKSAATEKDLDAFLLGDLEDSDDGAGDGEDGFDEDFDKI